MAFREIFVILFAISLKCLYVECAMLGDACDVTNSCTGSNVVCTANMCSCNTGYQTSSDGSQCVFDTTTFACTFEANDLCMWQQSTFHDDQFNWTVKQGNTPSVDTGPTVDHTLQTANGHYIFIEASSPRRLNDTARLYSPTIASTTTKCLHFWYHMYGTEVNTLNVFLKAGASVGTLVWTRTGNRGNNWYSANFNIRKSSSYKIVFEGIRGTDYKGDIGLDDLFVTEGSCSTLSASQLRLTNGTRQSQGRLEVLYNNMWGTVCDDGFNNNAAAVVCRTLGYTGRYFAARGQAYFGAGSGQIWLDDVTCDGTEPTLAACRKRPWGQEDCRHSEDVGVDCQPCTCTFEANNLCMWQQGTANDDQFDWTLHQGKTPSRITGPSVDHTLQTENGHFIFIETSGQRLNDTARLYSPTIYSTTTKCLHFWYHMYGTHVNTLNVFLKTGASIGTLVWTRNGNRGNTWYSANVNIQKSSSYKVVFDGVRGTGYHGDIGLDDLFVTEGLCSTLSASQIRLTNGTRQSQGRLEVIYSNMWGTVCDDSFDDNAAAVVCRTLGYTGTRFVARPSAYFGRGSGPIWLDDVTCDGNEPSLAACRKRPWGHENCVHHEDVSVDCQPSTDTFVCTFEANNLCMWQQSTSHDDQFDWTLQQGNISSNSTGPSVDHTLQTANGFYIFIEASDTRRLNDKAHLYSPTITSSTTKCLHFWYHMYGTNVSTINVFLKSGTYFGSPVWTRTGSRDDKWYSANANIQKSSSYNIVFEGVRDTGYSGNIGLDDLVVTEGSCSNLSASQIRLTNGTRQSQGRLEILYNSTWGTVCDDSFDNNAAAVVCRTLGFTGRDCVARHSAFFGAGSGQIWLDDITCNGTEPSLVTCSKKPWGEHNCSHNDDVGVDCQIKIPLGGICALNDDCSDSRIVCSGSKCACGTSFYDSNGFASGGDCSGISDLQVTGMTFRAVTTTSLTVSWTLPAASSYINTLLVTWTAVNGGERPGSLTLNSPTLTSVSVGSMTPGRAYTFSVVSRNTQTETNSNRDTSTSSKQAAKPVTPSGLLQTTDFDASDGSITLQWSRLNFISGYDVTLEKGSDVVQQTFTSNNYWYVNDQNLLNGERYNVTVVSRSQVFTSGNDSSAYVSSDTYMELIKTVAKQSSEPKNLTILLVTSRSMIIFWDYPEITNSEEIVGYILQIRDAADTCVYEQLFNCSDCIGLFQETRLSDMLCPENVRQPDTMISTHDLSRRITVTATAGLLPDIDYTVSVSAVNDYGQGNISILNQKTDEEEPQIPTDVAATDIKETSMMIVWKLAGPRPGTTNYTIHLIADTPAESPLTTVQGFEKTNQVVSGLQENWDYTVSVTASTSKGSKKASTSVKYVTKPAAPGPVDAFRVQTPGDDYSKLQVSWKIPSILERNSYITSYVFKHNATASENLKSLPMDAEESYVYKEVVTVVPEMYYHLEVYARNEQNQNGTIVERFLEAPAGVPDETNLGGIIGGVVGTVVTIAVVAIIIGVMMYKRRRKVPNQMSKRADDPEDITAIDDTIPRKRPVKLTEFEVHLKDMHRDNNLQFSAAYEDLKAISPRHSQDAANEEENKTKNRYINILPFDHSRVKLCASREDDTDDYINGNYLPGYRSPREYIGCQGPIPGTIDDFWRMVWEQNVSVVVMLILCKEGQKIKCEQYWPNEVNDPKQFGDVVVEVTSYSSIKSFDYRVFKLVCNGKTRILKHFHFLSWLDFQANVQHEIILDFITQVRSHVQPQDTAGPMIVHCSAGVVRTGTYIVLDHLMQFIEDHDFDVSVDIFDMVMKLRDNRPHMVQTEQQYVFIHDCVKILLQRKRLVIARQSNVYEKLDFDVKGEENIYQNQEEVTYENLKVGL